MIEASEIGKMHIGDYFIAATGGRGYKYTYLGNDGFKAEKVDIPFREDPPTLREAVRYYEVDKLDKVECCHSCLLFSLSPASAPAGWCTKYRCQQVNTNEFNVCDDYKQRPELRKGATE